MAKKQGRFELSMERRAEVYDKLESKGPRKGEKLPSFESFVYKEGVAKKFLSKRAGVTEPKHTTKRAMISKVSPKAEGAISKRRKATEDALKYD